jgi:hypothetical protein
MTGITIDQALGDVACQGRNTKDKPFDDECRRFRGFANTLKGFA